MIWSNLLNSLIQCTPDIVAMVIVAIRISGHFFWDKIHLFYCIQVGYSGQSDIVARKGWPKVATITEVHCNRC